MPKADFEFYSLPGLDMEFVTPKPDNDPYAGLFHPAQYPEIVDHDWMNKVSKLMPFETRVEHELGISNRSLPQSQSVPPNALALDSKTLINIYPFEDDIERNGSFVPLINLETLVQAGEARSLVSSLDIERADLPEPRKQSIQQQATPRRTLVPCVPFLADADGEPREAVLNFSETIVLRAYRWLPGKIRRSRVGAVLPPVFQPVSSPLFVNHAINVVVKNPFLESTETEKVV